MQTTVQDLGRHGYGRFGVAVNGAADRASLRAANRLVGNPDDAAALEITLTGPRIRFHRRLAVAIAGADLGARLNGQPVVAGRAVYVIPGDKLAFAPAADVRGIRAYLAVAGGIDVPVVMGSRSTDLTAGFGGYLGRALRAGDRLTVGDAHRGNALERIAATPLGSSRPIRVVRGPQADRFAPETWERFIRNGFTVSSESNRVGLRLRGPELRPVDGADIVSEGIVTGAIQVTGEGQPIVMLPGHATIGGYTKIATVIDADLDRLGQLRPGETVRFREVSLDQPAAAEEWSLPGLVRLARLAGDPRVGGFSFEDHASGASLRLGRANR
jgi:antagonist of KipI